MTKKERKRTMVEELMQDVEMVAKTKKKYSEILARKKSLKRRGASFGGSTNKRSKYKNKTKSH